MKTRSTIITEIESLQFGYWNEEFIPIDVGKQADVDLAAEALGCSKALIDTLGSLIESATELLAQDLGDIWGRLDRLEH